MSDVEQEMTPAHRQRVHQLLREVGVLTTGMPPAPAMALAAYNAVLLKDLLAAKHTAARQRTP